MGLNLWKENPEDDLELMAHDFSKQYVIQQLLKTLPSISDLQQLFPNNDLQSCNEILNQLLTNKYRRTMLYKDLEHLASGGYRVKDLVDYFIIRNESDGIFDHAEYDTISIIQELSNKYPIIGDAYHQFIALGDDIYEPTGWPGSPYNNVIIGNF